MNTVVFDLDGVIIDSKEVQVGALRDSYRTCVGKGEPPYEEFFRMSGSSLEVIFSSLNLPLNMADYYRKFSVDHMEEIKIVKGMEQVLEYLKNRTIKVGLCTGKERARTVQILRKLEIEQYFDCIVCSDDVLRPKPDAESLVKCMAYLDATNRDTILVGDAVNDILCAHHAGVKSIAVTWGEGSVSELKYVQPSYIVYTVGELLNVVEMN